jgi:hypothetical protein
MRTPEEAQKLSLELPPPPWPSCYRLAQDKSSGDYLIVWSTKQADIPTQAYTQHCSKLEAVGWAPGKGAVTLVGAAGLFMSFEIALEPVAPENEVAPIGQHN